MKHLIWLMMLMLTMTFCSFAQNKTQLKEKKNISTQQANSIIGTWKLIEYADLDTITGKWKYAFGQHPRGYFTYTQNGVVNLNISTDNPLKISEDSAKRYTVNLSDYLKTNSLGYFGTYTIDFEKSVVIHHVTGGSLPWYVDTDQSRPFIFKGDTLIIGDNKTWKRVLIKTN